MLRCLRRRNVWADYAVYHNSYRRRIRPCARFCRNLGFHAPQVFSQKSGHLFEAFLEVRQASKCALSGDFLEQAYSRYRLFEVQEESKRVSVKRFSGEYSRIFVSQTFAYGGPHADRALRRLRGAQRVCRCLLHIARHVPQA